MDSIFAMHKPVGVTSHDVVWSVKKITGQKVGHAGTLDPLASGVLVVGVGRAATKQLATIVQKEKEYVADIVLGQTSTTDDAEGQKTVHTVSSVPDRQRVLAVLDQCIGSIDQQPPVFSAIKSGGQRAYRIARRGGMPVLGPRRVEIYSIDLLEYQYPHLTIKAVTGPGVYIRALARDIGQQLGTGGYLAGLVRTRVGQFVLTDAISIEELKKQYAI